MSLPGARRLEGKRLLAVGLAVVVEDDVLLHAEALADAQMVEQRALLNLNERERERYYVLWWHTGLEPSFNSKKHQPTKNIRLENVTNFVHGHNSRHK